jgi:hypothetical protein
MSRPTEWYWSMSCAIILLCIRIDASLNLNRFPQLGGRRDMYLANATTSCKNSDSVLSVSR